jgi:transposase
MAPFYIDDSANTDNLCIWLDKFLCPELRLGQVVIMDKAAFHKSSRVRYIIENIGCRLLYLPLYSPDLKPIEYDWAWLKNKLYCLWRHVANFYDRLSIAPNINYGTRSLEYTIIDHGKPVILLARHCLQFLSFICIMTHSSTTCPIFSIPEDSTQDFPARARALAADEHVSLPKYLADVL